ncbi:MAG: GNAT family N-acetyltransferase [Clostridia bacterium]|nr:GNAT family N-acetyltransferase [Clostridia bacterium]
MKILHPEANPMGLPAEDVFLAVDDMGTELGSGYICYQFQPHLYPECPLNLYFSFNAQPSARYMILGALLARARQLRDVRPDVRARVYTDIDGNDIKAQDFYAANNFDLGCVEKFVVMPIPEGDGRIPMSCSVVRSSLAAPEEKLAFITRLQQNDLGYITPELLEQLMMQPHFLCLGLYRNTELIGEILMAGQGEMCTLHAIYITPNARRQGMARALLHRSMAVMSAEGVTQVSSRIITLSTPQVRLMNDFGGRDAGVNAIYPSLFM